MLSIFDISPKWDHRPVFLSRCFWLLRGFAQETINSNGSAPEETFARAYRTHRRFSCRGRSRVAKTRWKATGKCRNRTAPRPAEAVYRAVIRERERDTRWLWLLRYSHGGRKNVFRGNQRRSEPASVNEPRRFFLTDTVTVKASQPCCCIRDGATGEEKILNARFHHR